MNDVHNPEPPALDVVGDAPLGRFPGTIHVLVVDDNRDAATSLGILLELAGAEVRVCHDGLTALATAAWFRPDVGVLDVNMPEMDGCELARRLREQASGEPLFLIAVTAMSYDLSRRREDAAGFDRHYTKPADPAALVSSLTSLMWWLRADESEPG